MQHLEGSGTPVLYIGRTVLKEASLTPGLKERPQTRRLCPLFQRAVLSDMITVNTNLEPLISGTFHFISKSNQCPNLQIVCLLSPSPSTHFIL